VGELRDGRALSESHTGPVVAAEARVQIEGDESRRAVVVARVRVGERIGIGNGTGTIVWETVATTSTGTVQIDVDDVSRESTPVPEPWLEELAKGALDERAIQAATKLGISGVIPAGQRSAPCRAGRARRPSAGPPPG
jgi:16S rRNA (uracil1498-N3)-methyltransferase